MIDYVNNLNVPIGETRRMNCPNCNGYKTFTVTNNMGALLWNCYKVSCNVSGKKRVRLSVDDIQDTLNKKSINIENEFELPEYIVKSYNQNILNWFKQVGVDHNIVDFFHDVKENRVVFTIQENGRIVGAIGRSLEKRLPKWKKYGKSGLPFTFGTGNVAVVVEDCLSALAVGGGVCVGVAVLGTTLTDKHREYLSQFSTAIIALDPDALPKTLAFAKELRGHVKNVHVLKVKDDLKYKNKQDFINLYNLIPKEILDGTSIST